MQNVRSVGTLRFSITSNPARVYFNKILLPNFANPNVFPFPVMTNSIEI